MPRDTGVEKGHTEMATSTANARLTALRPYRDKGLSPGAAYLAWLADLERRFGMPVDELQVVLNALDDPEATHV